MHDEAQLERINAAGAPLPIRPGGEERSRALAQGELLHRELRPDLAADYCRFIEAMFAEGARLTQLVDEGEVRALALWRLFHTTYCGLRLELEDLITRSPNRSKGYGTTLLEWLEGKGRALNCATLTLNSAAYRADAHRFYFRRHYKIIGFHFSKDLLERRPVR